MYSAFPINVYFSLYLLPPLEISFLVKDWGFRPSGLAVRTPGQGTKPAADDCCLLQATVPFRMSPESVFLLRVHSMTLEGGWEKSQPLPC